MNCTIIKKGNGFTVSRHKLYVRDHGLVTQIGLGIGYDTFRHATRTMTRLKKKYSAMAGLIFEISRNGKIEWIHEQGKEPIRF